jgi:hypothetical protein
MKSMHQLFAIACLLVPVFASAGTVNCSGTGTSLKIEGGLEVGQTIHATFVNSDPVFGQTAEINCQVEKTVSGIYCVDDEVGVNYVLTLTNINSSLKQIVVTEQGHGGYGSQSFDFAMSCQN